jgi:hypothetical protein
MSAELMAFGTIVVVAISGLWQLSAIGFGEFCC